MDREERITAYMQDRLDAEARRSFELEMSGDAGLAAEVATLRAVRREFASEDVGADAGAGWDRLSASIDRVEMNVPTPANAPGAPRFAIWQVAAMIVAAVMVWEVAVSPQLETSDPTRYQTVSEAASGPVLQVVFKADAPIGEIAALLQDVGGTIKDGPSAVGLYRVGFGDAASAEAALATLSTRTDLIETVLEQ